MDCKGFESYRKVCDVQLHRYVYHPVFVSGNIRIISGYWIYSICARDYVMLKTSIMEYLRRNLFCFMTQHASPTIAKIIFEEQILLEAEDIDPLIS